MDIKSTFNFHEIWPDISINAIELELAKLLKEGLIEKVGNTNGVAYFWKNGGNVHES